MKRLISLLLVLLAAIGGRATNIGDWTSYLSYHYATKNLVVGNLVYALYDGNLLVYNTEDTEVKFFSKETGLSGRYISFFGYSYSRQCLVLAYDDGNIDLLGEDGSIRNIPQIKNGNDGDMVIGDLSVADDYATVTTGTGIALIDLQAGRLMGYYDLKQTVYAATVFDGALLAATPSAILSCSLEDNLLDHNNWRELHAVRAKRLLPFGDGLLALVPWVSGVSERTNGIWFLGKAGTDGQREVKWVQALTHMDACADSRKAFFFHPSRLTVIDKDDPRSVEFTYTPDKMYYSMSYAPDGTYWVSNYYGGLCTFERTDDGLQPSGTAVGGYGPRRDLCYYMQYAGDRLLVAGGRVEQTGKMFDGVAYTYEGGEWKHLEDDGLKALTGVAYSNATSIVQDPDDPSHHFVSTGGTGLYEFRDYKFVRQYTWKNSPLIPAAGAASNPNYVRTDGLNLDAAGNLWMVNNERDTLLWVLKPDGSWKGIYNKSLQGAPTCEKTLIDRRGRLWVASRRTVTGHTAGLLCLDYNGTIDNTADDLSTYRTSAPNQDGTDCSLASGVYALAEDRDGAIWVGTGGGLYVIDDPDTWSGSGFYFTQPKVPRNDGTNYADYLMAGVAVTAIAVDGGNRKWIGTASSGLYLVSPDGTEVLHHFDTSNSPILSDCVYAIAPDMQTGEVMVGTDAGLCSYRSEATRPAETLERGNVVVYPNPVRPEYSGNIVVKGLTVDADVKVTTAGGQVVAAGTSVGGTFVWDGRTQGGSRVSSGVYYFMVATADGQKGVVAKVVVI